MDMFELKCSSLVHQLCLKEIEELLIYLESGIYPIFGRKKYLPREGRRTNVIGFKVSRITKDRKATFEAEDAKSKKENLFLRENCQESY